MELIAASLFILFVTIPVAIICFYEGYKNGIKHKGGLPKMKNVPPPPQKKLGSPPIGGSGVPDSPQYWITRKLKADAELQEAKLNQFKRLNGIREIEIKATEN